MKKTISTILIIIGVMLILTLFLSEEIIKYFSNNIVDDEISNEVLISNNSRDIEGEFDYDAIEDVDIMGVLRSSFQINKDLIIGTIMIADLDLDLPIMKGLSGSNLMLGASTMKADQSFGQGNFSLAGHYMKNKDLLFGSLMDIELDTMVYVSDGKKMYEYKIYETLVVPDTALEMISDDKADEVGKPVISLMTCYFTSKSGKRFFALGELVDEYNVD